MTRKDVDGFDLDPLVLGADLLDAAENLGEGDYFIVREGVGGVLTQGRLVSDEDRAAARDVIQKAIEPVRAARGADSADPEVVAWNAAAREAMRVIRREAQL